MDVNIAVRWADDTKQLAANLREGTDAITATKASVDKLVQSLGGDKLITAAHRMVAAIGEVGGAEKLTNAERERTNALLDKAIQKYTALGQQAPTAMRQLEEATRKVTDSTQKTGSAWDALAGKVNIQEVFTNPLGSAKAAMGGLAESIGTAGIVAAGAATAIGAIGLALFHMAESAAAVGGELNDMSEKTGMSVPALSRLSLATRVAGSDLSTMTSALFMFEKNMAEGSDKFEKGLSRIGLTLEEVKAAGVDHYLEIVADHMKATTDPTERAAAAMELYGKQGREIIPTLMKLSDALNDVADIKPWTDQQAADAERFEMQMKSMLIHVESFSTSVGRDLIGPMSTLASLWKANAEGVLSFASAVLRLEQAKQGLGYLSAMTGMGALPTAPASPKLPTNALVVPLANEHAALKQLSDDYAKLEAAQKKAEAAAEAWAKVLEEVNSAGKDYRQTILGIDGAIVPWAEHLLQSGVSAQKVAEYYGLTDTQVKALETSIKADADAEKTLSEIRNKLEAATTKLNDTMRESNSLELVAVEAHLKLAAAMHMVEQSIPQTVAGFYGMAGALEQVGLKSTEIDDLKVKLELAAKSISQVVSDSFAELPAIMQRAFEGGGGLEGAAKSLGVRLADELIASYAKRMQSAGTPLTASQKQAIGLGTGGAAALGQAFGGPTAATIAGVASSIGGAALAASSVGAGLAAAGVGGAVALGAATMGLGAAAVGVYMLAKHFLTVSQNEKDARAEFAKLQDLYGSLPDTISAVSKAYAAMGKSGAEAQADLKRALDATHDSAEAEDAALKPIVETLAAAQKKSDDITAAFDQMTQAGQLFGGTVPDAFKDAVRQMAAMNGVTDEQRKLLLSLARDVKPNFEQLTQTAAKYGVTLEGLGKNFQQANIEGRAKDISSDFDALVKAGGDAGGILSGMSDEISALVNDSKKFGTAIPENMRPLIEELLRAGKLTDEAGNALTDMAGISFEATPLDDSIQSLADAIKALTDALSGTAGSVDAATARVGNRSGFLKGDGNDGGTPVWQELPGSNGTIYGRTDSGNGPVYAGSQGYRQGDQVDGGFSSPIIPIGFADGSAGFQDFGAGTLAVLHGREAVITEDSWRQGTGAISVSPAAGAPSLGENAIVVNVDARGALLSDFGVRELGKRIQDGFWDAVQQNKNSGKTRGRAALEIQA